MRHCVKLQFFAMVYNFVFQIISTYNEYLLGYLRVIPSERIPCYFYLKNAKK